ncbi:hypothetical protein [Mesomycoplasma dispar]|uniref:Uncharacterized protein n=1 Tax=Mesomycoplasma dispar TaxID=86660 RepID=A0ABN5DRF1_9BACT|nr:hypothetical protein [Mesomycoplasma dispar]ATP59791.1 hypothetical protein CSW10_02525 [Mesomycoplasma dispar]
MCFLWNKNKFSINEKIKYIKIAESQGFKSATIHFANGFREIYKNKSVNKKSQKEGFLQTYANNLIRNWQKKL